LCFGGSLHFGEMNCSIGEQGEMNCSIGELCVSFLPGVAGVTQVVMDGIALQERVVESGGNAVMNV
jgi:hypothetical protein